MARILGGLLLLITGGLSVAVARQGRHFRQPTPAERDDIATPLARIAVRHLPLDVIGVDLADGTEAAIATHAYLTAGALVTEDAAEAQDFTQTTDGSPQ